ncbi:MAG TPA: hypothetical protein VGX51_13300, partial [Solirubrobacteraceae bacterium]|nr:hypothetical protein [Solirubrobacteraceae bacterium]
MRRALTITVALGALEAVSGPALAARPVGIVSAFPGPVGIAGPGVGHMTLAGGLQARLVRPAVQDSRFRFRCKKPNPEKECYGPQQIRVAYRFKSLLGEGKDGSGRTIVLIDSFQDPTI